MNILVTDDAGFVGSHPVDALVKKHGVTIYDNLDPQVHEALPGYLNDDAEFIKEDMIEKYIDINTIGTASCFGSSIF